MQIKDIIQSLESWAPPSLQEPYDNSGLIIGDRNETATSVLVALDVTETVIEEAVALKSNLVIAHHPLIFSGIKHIGNHHWLGRCIQKAIKNDINIYALHTNLDNVATGVNRKIAEKIGLGEIHILKPKPRSLLKLTVFVPRDGKQPVLDSLYYAGAGDIGNYSHCSFQVMGEGTFKPNHGASPTIGKKGEDETVNEARIEVILPSYLKNQVLSAMRSSHPYEEVAYYLSELVNENQEVGSGMIGKLKAPVPSPTFLNQLKEQMGLSMIRYTPLVKEHIQKVAICGGSGSFLLKNAMAKQVDIFITADFKYHDFFEANGQMIIADIGHYESEVFTKELIVGKLTKIFPNFAFRLSKVDTNPINYL